MRLISFVGTTIYREATYCFEGKEYTGKYFPVVATRAFEPAELLLVATQEAYAMHFESIADQVSGITKISPVRIPSGTQESELWTIFDILTGVLHERDEVIFDITLSFRSIPILAVIAAAYWRVSKDVTLQRLVYGAFEAKDEQGRSPIFDLTPMIGLMEWTVATDKFLKTGNAHELSMLLRQAHSLPYRNRDQQSDQELPRHLQNAATSIDNVSQAMRLTRPHEVMSESRKLDRNLSLVREEVDVWAKPFATLLDQTQQEYRQFAVEEPLKNVTQSLESQLALIHWYADKDQIVQAISLAREWVVSLVIFRLGWMMIEDRDYVENLLNSGAKALERKQALPPPIRKLTDIKAVLTTWDWLRDLRNDVAHCGMRKQPRSTNSILSDAKTLAVKLQPLLDTAISASPKPD